jgi:hypothetical protein
VRNKTVRELHKKDELLAAALRYPILWDGHLARPCIISGQDARTTDPPLLKEVGDLILFSDNYEVN